MLANWNENNHYIKPQIRIKMSRIKIEINSNNSIKVYFSKELSIFLLINKWAHQKARVSTTKTFDRENLYYISCFVSAINLWNVHLIYLCYNKKKGEVLRPCNPLSHRYLWKYANKNFQWTVWGIKLFFLKDCVS